MPAFTLADAPMAALISNDIDEATLTESLTSEL
jgi:hypothetical protein